MKAPTDNHQLTQFNEPEILRAIGHPRIARLLDGFTDDLRAANLVLPSPPDSPVACLASGDYLNAVAAILSKPDLLPARLIEALLILEHVASPENRERLQAAIQSRLPHASLEGLLPLDHALELFFLVPDELAQFKSSAAVVPPPQQSNNPLIHQSIPLPPDPPIQQSILPDPSIHQSTNPLINQSILSPVPPWPEPVNGKALLDSLLNLLVRFVVLPKWAAETLALWILHTYAFQLREVSTYIGIESPEHRCGKTTLVTILSELAHRSVVSSNISPPAFFRVIEDFQPTLFIDEADTFLPANEQLRGILNSGYKKKTAFVLRAANQPATSAEDSGSPTSTLDTPTQVTRFSCWCPKVIARIGRLPVTLADRCIVFRMQRKTAHEECERIKNLDPEPLRRQCLRFVQDHSAAIAGASPELPAGLNDRAADIWEPLFALADLAGADWPERARQAALALTASSQDHNPTASLLLDIFLIFSTENVERMFTRDLVVALNYRTDRPWMEARNGKEITDAWLSQRLRPYGIRPRTLRIGESQAKGYFKDDFLDVCQRYVTKSDLQSLVIEPSSDDSSPSPDPKNGS